MPYLEIERDSDGRFAEFDRYSREAKATIAADQALRLMSGALEQVRVAGQLQIDAIRNAQVAGQIFDLHSAVLAPEGYLLLVKPPAHGNYSGYRFTFTEARRRSCPHDDVFEVKHPAPVRRNSGNAGFVATSIEAQRHDKEFPFRAIYNNWDERNRLLSLGGQTIALSGQERIRVVTIEQVGEHELVNGQHPQEMR